MATNQFGRFARWSAAILLGTAVTASAAWAKTMDIVVWANADQNELYRVENIDLAARILEHELKIEGRDIQIRTEKQTFAGKGSWDKMKQAFSLAVQSGSGPHIILAGHEDVAVWGAAGLIQPIENIADLEAWPFNNVYPNLWDFASWNGQVWAVPQDAEARPFFGWKPHLKAIGYSDEQIAALPEKIKSGEYTLENVLIDAKKMQDAGLVAEGYGFYPRPAKGADFWQFYSAFGGKMSDEASGKLLLDTQALGKFYTFFHDAVHKYGVTKKTHIGLDWDQWYREVATGKAGTWHGGTWHYARYTKKEGLTDFFDKVMFSLIPAGDKRGQATTLTHPLVYLVSKRAQGEEAEIAARLLEIATEPRLNTLHAIASAHLAVAEAQETVGLYAADRWASEATDLLKSAFALPNNADFGQYDEIVWKGLSAAWSGDKMPEEAVKIVIDEIRATMGDKVVIR